MLVLQDNFSSFFVTSDDTFLSNFAFKKCDINLTYAKNYTKCTAQLFIMKQASWNHCPVQILNIIQMPPPGPCVILCLLISNHSLTFRKSTLSLPFIKNASLAFLCFGVRSLHIMTFLYLCSFIQYDIYISSVILLSLLCSIPLNKHAKIWVLSILLWIIISVVSSVDIMDNIYEHLCSRVLVGMYIYFCKVYF